MLGASDLNLHAAIERHGVIAGRRLLVRLVEGRLVAIAVSGVNVACEWHKADIGEVAAPCAAQVRLGKALDLPIAVLVARASFPTGETRIGSGLHHAERICSRGGRVPVATRSNERINVVKHICPRDDRGRECKHYGE